MIRLKAILTTREHTSMGCRSSKETDKDGKSIYEKESLADHEGSINCMAISEDSSLLITGSDDCTARMWSTKTDDTECLGVLEGHTSYITCVASSDTYVLTGSGDATIRKWDMTTCECLHIYKGHEYRINQLICTGEFIFSSSCDKTVRAWLFDTTDVTLEQRDQDCDLKQCTDDCVKVFKGHSKGVFPIIYLPDSTYASSDSDDDAVTISPGDILITGSTDNTAKSWSCDDRSCLKTFRGHTGAVSCMTTDGDGTTLFTAGADRNINIWDISSGKNLKTMEGHTQTILCLQMVSKLLYSGSADKMARCWVTAFGECTRTYEGHKHSVNCLKVEDGVVFTGCGDTSARAYDAKSGALKRTYMGHGSAINCIQYIDKKLYTGSTDGILKVWDAKDIADDPAREPEEQYEQEEFEEKYTHKKETELRVKDLERRLDRVGVPDEDIDGMEQELAGIKDYDD